MGTLMQLGAALLITVLLFYLHRRQLDKAHSRGWVEGQGDGYRTGYSERRQLDYHAGHADGLHEGRLKERLEWETREYKQTRDYDQGFADGRQAMLEALRDETHAAMYDDLTTTNLSA